MLHLLRLLPPETAHRLSVALLKHGIHPRAKKDAPALSRHLLGTSFSNPIGLSAGAEKKAEALAGWAHLGFGFVEAGTVTLHARQGNPAPRIWRVGPGEVVNWMGLPGDGLAPFVQNLRAFHARPECASLVLGASLASPSGMPDEFRQLSAGCAPLVDYLTLNASCPNLAHDAHGSAAQAMEGQLKAVIAEAGGKPVLLKLGPTRDEASLRMMVTTAMEAGAAGIVATNTVPHDKKSLLGALSFRWPSHDGQPVGGYSGAALLETSCWMVERTRLLVGPSVPVIGVGGVQSGTDALRLFRAGADLIQIYTGLTAKGPALIQDIKTSLTASA